MIKTDTQDLAKQLSNPVADLVSVPFQLNYDSNIGANDSGSRWTLNVQPVAPFSLNANWNLISRTIIPIVSTDGIPFGDGTETGLGDTVQSFFFFAQGTDGKRVDMGCRASAGLAHINRQPVWCG